MDLPLTILTSATPISNDFHMVLGIPSRNPVLHHLSTKGPHFPTQKTNLSPNRYLHEAIRLAQKPQGPKIPTEFHESLAEGAYAFGRGVDLVSFR